MKLNAQQIAFFDVFGYLVLPKVFNEEKIAAMSKDFDAVALADRDGKEFEAVYSVGVALEDTDSFKDLKYRDELFYPLQQLLGKGFVTTVGPGGALFVGDTQWHPDVAEVSEQTRIKVGIYLDPVRKESGALRVVPGSHKNPLHELLQPLRMGRIKESLKDGSLMSNIAPAGEKGRKERKKIKRLQRDPNTSNLASYRMKPNPGRWQGRVCCAGESGVSLPATLLQSPGPENRLRRVISAVRHYLVVPTPGEQKEEGHRRFF